MTLWYENIDYLVITKFIITSSLLEIFEWQVVKYDKNISNETELLLNPVLKHFYTQKYP